MHSDQYFTWAASGLRPFSDFDWFVVDSCGHLAVMASGGHGRVPRAVFSDRTAYWKLHDELVRAGGGDAPADVDPWEHYVAAGLSVCS